MWQAGQQYVRLEAREASAQGPHDHPVELRAGDLVALLQALQARQARGILRFASKEPVPLFTTQMAGLLAGKLAEGLAAASPEQELTFIVVGLYRGKLLAGDQRAVGGRVFYRQGRLHLILGDVLRSLYYGPERDIRGFETEVDRRMYPLYAGSRDRAGSKGWELLIGEGMALHDDGRRDWVEIDLPVVMGILRQQQAEEEPAIGADVPAADAASLREQMRRQRVELARKRKRMGEANQVGTVEERLKILESLRDQGLVTEEEYRVKREAILDSL